MTAQIDTSPCPAPAWLPGGHLQTLYGALVAPANRLRFVRERVRSADGDFLDFDWSAPGLVLHPKDRKVNRDGLPKKSAATRWIEASDRDLIDHHQDAPALVLLHGLEGDSNSRYVQSILQYFRARGWLVVLAHFRGCSGTPNLLARSYFSGDIDEVDFILNAVIERAPMAQWHVAGVSLGGNALLKYLGERAGQTAPIETAVSICAPMDLFAAGNRLSEDWVCRQVYTRHFLRSMKPKIMEKASRFPGAIDVTRISRARTLKDFDDAYTAPMHGFANALDYWQKASSKPWLPYIEVPTLIINPRNDPFIPEPSLPGPSEASAHVTLHQPAEGGHMGFVTGRFPGNLNWLPARLAKFFNVRQ
ncbi:YheT family hydrolase [Orrella daihaiensis]|uniref:Alpha/beta fold hydrolase n=1 Tax=Orrella daihaiensis TaxID=2782176 RepID=A0ABY4AMD9_9BURK|nr:alpha/beta fold hydrolase [Orrella daihaiensis]UOD51339.1 alpha/beta fold hydrolase [Orrella daihaiensis]